MRKLFADSKTVFEKSSGGLVKADADSASSSQSVVADLFIPQWRPYSFVFGHKVNWWVLDSALIAILALLSRGAIESALSQSPTQIVVFICSAILVLARRLWPVLALQGAIVLYLIVAVWFENEPNVATTCTMLLAYSTGVQSRRWSKPRVLIAAVLFAALIAGLGLFEVASTDPVNMQLLFLGRVVGETAAILLPTAVALMFGALVGGNRNKIVEARKRARVAEETRETEAQKRVIEERLRIARDVHDLIAHHIAVISIQSGVAKLQVENNPEGAKQAIEVTRESAAAVIDELGTLLSVLRTPEKTDEQPKQDSVQDTPAPFVVLNSSSDEPSHRPTPNLGAISDLIDTFRSSGLQIEHVRVGAANQSKSMSQTAEVAAYRVVQEALTNAHKYGSGKVTVSLVHSNESLQVAVVNPVKNNHTVAPQGTRFGLIGMRERVEAVSGSLRANVDSTGKTFTVEATFPYKKP